MNKKLLPETNWLLANLLVHEHSKTEVVLSVKSMVEMTGLHNTRVTRAFAELIDAGILKRIVSKPEQGRPRHKYVFTSGCTSFPLLKDFPSRLEFVEIFIKSHREYEYVAQLKSLEKLVLLVMLCFSDSRGGIYNVGLSDLAKYSGMKKERIERYVELLAERGFIIKHTSGFTEPMIFGVVKGGYVLDLHKIFSKDSGLLSGFIINYESEAVTSNLEFNAIYSVFHVLRLSGRISKMDNGIKTKLIARLEFIPESNVDKGFLERLIELDLKLPENWYHKVKPYLSFHLDYIVGDILLILQEGNSESAIINDRFEEVINLLKKRLVKSKHAAEQSKESKFYHFLCELLTYAAFSRAIWLQPQLVRGDCGKQDSIAYIQLDEIYVPDEGEALDGIAITKYLMLGYVKPAMAEQRNPKKVTELRICKNAGYEEEYFEYSYYNGPSLRYNGDFKLIV